MNRAALLCLLITLTACAPPRSSHIVIGAKNFTEQVVLGELLAQEIEAKSNLKVERRFYLAGTYICQQALVSGRIDAYVEYTGTALTAVLKQPVDRDPQRRAELRQRPERQTPLGALGLRDRARGHPRQTCQLLLAERARAAQRP